MPTKKSTIKKDAKKSARVKRSGVRLMKAADKQASKARKNFSVSSGKKYAKKVTAAQTASNFEKEGQSRKATGVKTAKKKDLKVTPRSAAKRTAREAGYNKRKKM
jgi:uncharacterized protein (DUF1778 family)